MAIMNANVHENVIKVNCDITFSNQETLLGEMTVCSLSREHPHQLIGTNEQ